MLNSAVKKERMMAWTNTTSLENFFANQNKMLLKTCEKYQPVPGATRSVTLYKEPAAATSSRKDISISKKASQRERLSLTNALRSAAVGDGESLANKRRKRRTGRGGRGIGPLPKMSVPSYTPPSLPAPAEPTRSERLAQLKAEKLKQKEKVKKRAGEEAAVAAARLSADMPANLERALEFVEHKVRGPTVVAESRRSALAHRYKHKCMARLGAARLAMRAAVDQEGLAQESLRQDVLRPPLARHHAVPRAVCRDCCCLQGSERLVSLARNLRPTCLSTARTLASRGTRAAPKVSRSGAPASQ